MSASIRKSSRTHILKSQITTKSLKKQQLLDECMFPRTGRRGAPQVFPRKLFQILDEVDENVIGWTNQHGTSFTIKGYIFNQQTNQQTFHVILFSFYKRSFYLRTN